MYGDRPVVWIIGSSITREAFGKELLRERLDALGSDFAVEKYAIDRGAPLFTWAMADRLELRPGDVHIQEEAALTAGENDDWERALELQRPVTDAAEAWDSWKLGGRSGSPPEHPAHRPEEHFNGLAWTLAMARPDDPEAVAEAEQWIDKACARVRKPIPAHFLNTRAYVRLLAGDARAALDTLAEKDPAEKVRAAARASLAVIAQ